MKLTIKNKIKIILEVIITKGDEHNLSTYNCGYKSGSEDCEMRENVKLRENIKLTEKFLKYFKQGENNELE